MSNGFFRLAYCSRTVLPASDIGNIEAELARILEASRANNAKVGVTGALLYSSGCFAQVLEGPMDAVHQTFERIQCDPRHHDAVVLTAERIQLPLFSAWAMALAENGNPARANAVLLPALADPSAEAGSAVVTMMSELVCREAAWTA